MPYCERREPNAGSRRPRSQNICRRKNRILLTLLALGIKNIYIGPSLPAFLSPNVLKLLVEQYDLHVTGDPQTDLAAMLT